MRIATPSPPPPHPKKKKKKEKKKTPAIHNKGEKRGIRERGWELWYYQQTKVMGTHLDLPNP
jgi:hypothetical protein